MFPPKNSISEYYSPRIIILGKKLDYNRHCKYFFGSYIQAQAEHNPTNTINLRIIGIESLKNRDTEIEGGNIFANNIEYISPTLELNYYISPKVGISGAAGGAFRGEIIAAAPSYSLGIFLDLTK